VKHSPGPWRTCDEFADGCNCGAIFSAAEPRYVVARVAANDEDVMPPPPDDVIRADARLIAAAPELLSALQTLITADASEDAAILGEYLLRAKALIARIEGTR
jgi:hypothetical protein